MTGDRRAIGLTEDPTALRRCMITGPYISRLLEEFTAASGKVKRKMNSPLRRYTFYTKTYL